MINKPKLVTIAIAAIIGLGVAARLVHFGSLPQGLNRDEAALGYNAYAIAFHGQDEWAQPFPFMFKSFGDYKLPGYIYTLAPLIRLFGTHDWVIRFPSLIAGLAQIYLIYRLSHIIFKSKKTARIAAAIHAISPWAIFYSRTAFEANLALSLLLVTLIALLKPTNHKNISLAAISYTLAIATYNTPLLLLPLILLIVFLIKHPIRSKIITASALIVPALIVFLILQPLTQQKKNITIFSDPTILQLQRNNYSQAANIIERLRWHHYSNYAITMGAHWLETFSPNFLVLNGGSHPWHSLPGSGHHHMTTYLLFISAAVLLIKQRKNRQSILLLVLVFLSPLPAIVTVDAPHATRSLLTLTLISPLAAYALMRCKKIFKPALLGIVLVVLIESMFFIHRYFIWFPQNQTETWLSQLIPSIDNALATSPADEPIIITDPDTQPYIYVLLHQHISPQEFQNTVEYNPPDNAGLIRVARINRFIFTDQPGQYEGTVISNQTGNYQLEDKP